IILDQLNFLVTKLPEGRTFESLNSDFHFDGQQMIVTNLRMASPAGAFALQKHDGAVNLGTGEIDLDMVYEPVRNFRLPIITGTLTGFHVGGTYSNPIIRRQPSSGIKSLFERR